MSIIIFSGNIGEIQYKEIDGQSLLSFSVAENHDKKNLETNDYEQIGTTWHHCELWGKRAQHFKNVLVVGQPVIVEGRQSTKTSQKLDSNNKPYVNVVIKVKTIGIIPIGIESIKYLPKE